MTTKIETLTDVERHQLPLYTPYLGSKALRIIDARAAERAALTEQVAQLTRERDEARALHEQALNERDEAHKALELDCWNRSHDAEYEVARLTEQVAQLTAALKNIALGTVMLISEEHAVCRAELARRGSAK